MNNRELYFSQTQACKLYKITPKRFKALIAKHQLNTISDKLTLFSDIDGKSYEVVTIYVLKKDFIKSMIDAT